MLRMKKVKNVSNPLFLIFFMNCLIRSVSTTKTADPFQENECSFLGKRSSLVIHKDRYFTGNLLDFSCSINYFREAVCNWFSSQNFSGVITSFLHPSLCDVNLLPIFNQKFIRFQDVKDMKFICFCKHRWSQSSQSSVRVWCWRIFPHFQPGCSPLSEAGREICWPNSSGSNPEIWMSFEQDLVLNMKVDIFNFFPCYKQTVWPNP